MARLPQPARHPGTSRRSWRQGRFGSLPSHKSIIFIIIYFLLFIIIVFFSRFDPSHTSTSHCSYKRQRFFFRRRTHPRCRKCAMAFGTEVRVLRSIARSPNRPSDCSRTSAPLRSSRNLRGASLTLPTTRPHFILASLARVQSKPWTPKPGFSHLYLLNSASAKSLFLCQELCFT